MAAAARKTDAFKVFEANMERSRAFLRIFDKEPDGGRKAGHPSGDEKELLRGSLVFAVGALDAYLSDLILEIVPAHAPRSKELKAALAAISKSAPGLALQLVVETSGESRLSAFREALADWLESKSFQGPDKVVNALSYVGCVIPWKDFDDETTKNTAKELEKITKERHDIVHRGQKPYIRRSHAQDNLDLVTCIAMVIDRKVIGVYR